MLRAPLAATLLSLTAAGAHARSATPAPAFDVASVKLTQHGRNAEGLSISDVKIASPGRLEAINASLRECIEWAWHLKEYEFSGPDCLNDDNASYDIEAKAPPETPASQMRLMFQALLRERFKLAIHRETKVLPVYTLVVARNGPKLQPASPGAKSDFMSYGGRDGVRANSESASIADLAHRLSRDLGRPVFDKTEISGSYRIALEWAREGDGPSIFAAIQAQLGLKLEPAKAPIDILAVDNAQRVPTEN